MHMDQHTNITYRRGERHPSLPVTDAGQGEAEQKITALSTTLLLTVSEIELCT